MSSAKPSSDILSAQQRLIAPLKRPPAYVYGIQTVDRLSYTFTLSQIQAGSSLSLPQGDANPPQTYQTTPLGLPKASSTSILDGHGPQSREARLEMREILEHERRQVAVFAEMEQVLHVRSTTSAAPQQATQQVSSRLEQI